MRSSAVVGLSVALGVGITQVAGSLQGPGFPAWVHTVFVHGDNAHVLAVGGGGQAAEQGTQDGHRALGHDTAGPPAR